MSYILEPEKLAEDRSWVYLPTDNGLIGAPVDSFVGGQIEGILLSRLIVLAKKEGATFSNEPNERTTNV